MKKSNLAPDLSRMKIEDFDLDDIQLIGDDFERHGGMRSQAFASVFPQDEGAINEPDYWEELCAEVIGNKLTDKGIDVETLRALTCACIRMHNEHPGQWMAVALTIYYQHFKGMKRGVAMECAVEKYHDAEVDFFSIWSRHEEKRLVRRVNELSAEMQECAHNLLAISKRYRRFWDSI